MIAAMYKLRFTDKNRSPDRVLLLRDCQVAGSTGTTFARKRDVTKLEARFHPPFAPHSSYVVVGHIVARGGDGDPLVEPAASLAGFGAPATILATLKHLVAKTSPRSIERLETLRSRYWSFVRVGSDRSTAQDA